MTASVVAMTSSAAPAVSKRQGFSIESLIGTPEPSSSTSPPLAAATPPRPLPIRPFLSRDSVKDERPKAADVDNQRARDSYELRLREAEMLRERGILLEKEFREIRDRELAREKEIRELRESRGSNPLFQRLSPCSSSPPSPRTEKSLTPQSENRLSMWPGDELKHMLSNFHASQLESASLYQPLRVCNRTLGSLGGLPGVGTSPASALGVGIGPHFGHLPLNPLLYNVPRELAHQTHPLLAARYSGFIHPRYQMGPPPGLLFHPYRKPKRNRTAFSPSQLLQLEQAFEKNHYVVGQERKSLAAKLQLTETQVKVWFQNRRTKHKRMKAEEDGGSSGSQVEGQDVDAGKCVDGNDLSSYVDDDDGDDDDDDACSDEDEVEELLVTEDC